MNRFTRALLILALAVGLAGCAPLAAVAPTLAAPTVAAPGQGVASTQAPPTATAAPAATADLAAPTADLAATAGLAATADLAATPMPEPDAATTITLGEPIVVQGRGATVQGGTVTITAAGAYRLSGALANGQIVVDAADKGTVTLVLAGVDLTSLTSAPLYVRQAKEVALLLAEGTFNRLTDGETYVLDDVEAGEPNATLFSKDDLVIGGSGALEVIANYNDAITSKDDLTLTGGTITVRGVGDGVRGRDSLTILGGSLTVDVAGDALESNNDEDPERGVITIEGGVLNITAGGDAIEAHTRVSIRGGELNLVAGGGSAGVAPKAGSMGPGRAVQATTAVETPSMKGIKAGVEVSIEGGDITVDAADDAVHSNGNITITGGTLSLASGDDGIHADDTVAIHGGQITISRSYEGIEGATIRITDGDIRVVASDDGINVAGGVDGSSINGRPGQNAFAASGNRLLEISGGTLFVDALGDGLDVNGAISMSGGRVIVIGPTGNMNGALDYDRGFQLTGGYLLAVGSAGMAQAPDRTSTQPALMVNLTAPQAAGTLVRITTAQGQEVLSFEPPRQYQSVVYSAPELTLGASYTVSVGGAPVATLTLTDVVTLHGSGGMRGGPGGAPGGRR